MYRLLRRYARRADLLLLLLCAVCVPPSAWWCWSAWDRAS